jgi:RNA polymerase sigma-70 factor (ECF subfamily)
VPTPEESLLVEALRQRDETAFLRLVEQHHNSLLRLAQIYVRTRDVAEEVVQETWLGVLKGIENFEGRSSLKTWIFRILLNRARTRAEREGRTIPFSQLFDPAAEPGEPAMDPDRFLPGDHPTEAGHWAKPPSGWGDTAEKQLLTKELRGHLQRAIEGLPASQREVITLRDVEGWTSEEVCNALGVSETNQRVLLHRARTKVRRKLDNYLGQR